VNLMEELWTCTGDVMGSNPDWDTEYPESGFAWLSSVPPAKLYDIPIKTRSTSFLIPSQFIIRKSSSNSADHGLRFLKLDTKRNTRH
jgi:hypothetical protein